MWRAGRFAAEQFIEDIVARWQTRRDNFRAIAEASLILFRMFRSNTYLLFVFCTNYQHWCMATAHVIWWREIFASVCHRYQRSQCSDFFSYTARGLSDKIVRNCTQSWNDAEVAKERRQKKHSGELLRDICNSKQRVWMPETRAQPFYSCQMVTQTFNDTLRILAGFLYANVVPCVCHKS